MIISAAILLLVLFPIVLIVVFSLPPIQNRIIDRAVTYASDLMGTEVSIGHVNLTMRGGVEFNDILVRDLQSDTLLYAESVESKISIFAPMSKNLRLGNTYLRGAKFFLRARETEDGGSEMNIRQLTSKLVGSGRSPMEISFESVVVEQTQVVIEQLTHKNPEYGVDTRNILMNDLSGAVSELSINGSAIHAYIERMSGVEQSGFELANISGELYLTDGALSLSNMNLESRWSRFLIDHLLLVGTSWRDYRSFDDNVYVDIVVSDGALSSDDLAYFAPMVRDWGVMLLDMNIVASGNVRDMLLTVNNISYGETTTLSADMSIKGLPSVEDMEVVVNQLALSTSALDIDQLEWSLTGSGFSDEVLSVIDTMGDIEIEGEGEGHLRDMSLKVNLLSDVGVVDGAMRVRMGDGLSLKGNVRTEGVDVGALLGRSDMGEVSLFAVVDGVVDGVDSKGFLQTHIESLEVGGYRFGDIYVAGEVDNRGVESIEVVSRDRMVNFELKGRASSIFDGDRVPSYSLDADLRMVDLKALGINRRDSISTITALLSATGGGRSIEKCWGRAELVEGIYCYNQDSIVTNGASLDVNSEEGSRSLALSSEFGELNFASGSKVSDILNYMGGVMVNYLPSLYDNPSQVAESFDVGGESGIREASQLTITTYNTDALTNAINGGLKVGDGAKLSFRFDPYTRHLDGDIEASYLESGTTIAMGLDMNAVGRADSLFLDGSVRELFVGTSFVESANIRALAQGDRVDMDGGFTNPVDSASVSFGAVVGIDNNPSHGRTFDVEVLPSKLSRRNMEWSMSSPSIKIGREGIDIDQFKIENNDQLMVVNGRVSRSAEDRVVMTMRDFDLSIFSTLIKQLGYNIEGRTNGVAMLSSALSGGRFDAEVELDSVRINTLSAPPMKLTTEWNSSRNRARLFLADRISRDTLIRGYYIPSEVKYYALLNVDSLHMGVLDPPLGGVIENTSGFADLSLALMGERRDAHLNGTVTAYDLETTVGYTNVRYRVPEMTVNVVDNMLSVTSATIDHVDADDADSKFEGRGEVNLSVDLQHLSNIGYKVHLAHNDMMVLNTEESDNDAFYGRLYASGVVNIVGDKSGVKMNIIEQSSDNSHFFMPLSSKSNISTVDFITFVQPTRVDTMEMSELRRLVLSRQDRVRGAGGLQVDMALSVLPNTELQLVIDPTVGDIIKARGEGNINLRIAPKSNIFDIYGDYTITEGNYLFTLRNIVNKRFVIDPGSSIQWTGPAADPILDINAIYKLRTSLQPLMSDESTNTVPVNCIINLSDRLTQPDVSFAIELPSSDAEQQAVLANLLNDQESVSRQFFYLVLANSFIADSGGSSDLGVTTTAATGFELLTNQLSNWLSTSNYNVVIRYRPESELTGEEVDFGFSKGLVNNRLLVELEGNYIIDNKQAISEDASNFLGEAYITWLIDRAGALRLKGFTQTIDSYDENQGLQETGIGIYYRENFDNFSDLRDRVKARFRASDERLARRAARREESDVEESDDAALKGEGFDELDVALDETINGEQKQ